MAIPAPTLASLVRVKKVVVNLLNIEDDNAPYTGAVDIQAKFTGTAIQDKCLDGDAFVNYIIINTIGHPYRSFFIDDSVFDEIDLGGLIPPHFSDLDVIYIKDSGDPDMGLRRGTLAKNLDRMLMIEDNPDVYGAPPVYYPDGGSRLRFTGGDKAVIWRPHFAVDRSTPALQAPEVYEPAIEAFALTQAYMEGSDPAAAAWYREQLNMMVARIRDREMQLPDIEALRRIAA